MTRAKEMTTRELYEFRHEAERTAMYFSEDVVNLEEALEAATAKYGEDSEEADEIFNELSLKKDYLKGAIEYIDELTAEIEARILTDSKAAEDSEEKTEVEEEIETVTGKDEMKKIETTTAEMIKATMMIDDGSNDDAEENFLASYDNSKIKKVCVPNSSIADLITVNIITANFGDNQTEKFYYPKNENFPMFYNALKYDYAENSLTVTSRRNGNKIIFVYSQNAPFWSWKEIREYRRFLFGTYQNFKPLKLKAPNKKATPASIETAEIDNATTEALEVATQTEINNAESAVLKFDLQAANNITEPEKIFVAYVLRFNGWTYFRKGEKIFNNPVAAYNYLAKKVKRYAADTWEHIIEVWDSEEDYDKYSDGRKVTELHTVYNNSPTFGEETTDNDIQKLIDAKNYPEIVS